MDRPEQKEYIQPTSEELMQRLLSLATEYQTIHNSALKPEGDTISFRPDAQVRARLAQIMEEGANILRQVEPLLDAANLEILNQWKRDKLVIRERFIPEMKRQDALLEKSPTPETSRQEPQIKTSGKPQSPNSRLKTLGIS
jgi:hypothetical protein